MQDLYDLHAQEFSQTRQKPWSGWERCQAYWKFTPLRVLDLGCGNGRFYDYIKDDITNYVGLDTSEKLLKIAKEKYGGRTAKFIKQDIFDLAKLPKRLELVVGFGITHHIPNHDFRLKWFEHITKLVNSGGLIIFTFWNYHRDTRFINNAVSIPRSNNDFLLSWNGQKNQRTYHIYTESELKKIIDVYRNNDVELIEEFESDGKTNNLNNYLIFRKIKKISLL